MDTTAEALPLERLNNLARSLGETARRLDKRAKLHGKVIEATVEYFFMVLNIKWLRMQFESAIRALSTMDEMSASDLRQAKKHTSRLMVRSDRLYELAANGRELMRSEFTTTINAYLLRVITDDLEALAERFEDAAETLALALSGEFRELVLRELDERA